MKKVDAILISDIHLRETVPICRTDDYLDVQWKKLRFVKKLQAKYKCPVLCGGDLFHHWKPSPELISKTIYNLPKQFYTVYGQHDLPQHSLDLAYKSGIYTLMKAKAVEIFVGCHWKMNPNDVKETINLSGKRILVWHKFTYKGKEPWPGCNELTAKKLLKKYPQFDLILTGDNHVTFTEEYQGKLLVNPGSLFRTTAAQIDHKPCVFLWYASTNTVEQVFLPIAEGVISREHIEKTEERDKRIDAFVSSLNTEFGTELSFEKNLELFYQQNKVSRKVKRIIIESLE